MDCKKDCRPYPIEPAPYAPGNPGCGPRPGHRPPPPPPCPPSQYVGARYVPKFADPIEWDGAKTYENLIIVTHNNESYTSRCPVPPGIDITNERYWAKTGAYNAQLEQLKGSVEDLSSQVTGFAEDNKEFREKITQFEKDNAEMKNTVAKNDARVDALAERVATAETEIDGLQATTNQHTTEIADLHAKDEDLQRQITSNDNDIAALQAKDVEQDSRLDGIDTKLKSHDASIAQNTADIAKNTKNIQDNAANIAINAHEIADHAEQLKDHEARLTSQHKEITENHQAIERNTSDIASLRSDLTEDEAKIESNRDAIAHIQEKDVEQDGRLDALEKRTTKAEGRLDGLDTKTDATNTALAEEIDRAKAAEVANGKLIAANAEELANHAEELADHEARITALEGDNTTNKTDIADIKAKNTQQDTAIQQVKDELSHTNETVTGLANTKADKTALNDYVLTATYTAGQKAQDDATAAAKAAADAAQETATAAEGKATANETTIGNWSTAFPDEGDTVTKVVSELSASAEDAVKYVSYDGTQYRMSYSYCAPFNGFSYIWPQGTSRAKVVIYLPCAPHPLGNIDNVAVSTVLDIETSYSGAMFVKTASSDSDVEIALAGGTKWVYDKINGYLYLTIDTPTSWVNEKPQLTHISIDTRGDYTAATGSILVTKNNQ